MWSLRWGDKPEGMYQQATVEHIIPFAQGGPYTPENLMIICYGCNLKRSGHYLNPRRE